MLALTLLWVFIAVFPVGEWALMPLENRYAKADLPAKVDGIVLLTGDESPLRSDTRGQPLAGQASSRYLHLAALARRYPKARIVVTGDTAPYYKSSVTTHSIAAQILAAVGVDPARVTFEKDALTTYDNARLTARLAKPKKDEVWLLVTSAWHMPRSVLCFERQGMDVVPAPTDYLTADHTHFRPYFDLSKQLGLLRTALHEYYGLLGYWLTGRIERLWP